MRKNQEMRGSIDPVAGDGADAAGDAVERSSVGLTQATNAERDEQDDADVLVLVQRQAGLPVVFGLFDRVGHQVLAGTYARSISPTPRNLEMARKPVAQAPLAPFTPDWATAEGRAALPKRPPGGKP